MSIMFVLITVKEVGCNYYIVLSMPVVLTGMENDDSVNQNDASKKNAAKMTSQCCMETTVVQIL